MLSNEEMEKRLDAQADAVLKELAPRLVDRAFGLVAMSAKDRIGHRCRYTSGNVYDREGYLRAWLPDRAIVEDANSGQCVICHHYRISFGPEPRVKPPAPEAAANTSLSKEWLLANGWSVDLRWNSGLQYDADSALNLYEADGTWHLDIYDAEVFACTTKPMLLEFLRLRALDEAMINKE